MNDLQTRINLRLLYCPFAMTSKSADSDTEKVKALYAMLLGPSHARWFTHIVIVVRSWQEVPDALAHDVIKRVLHLCEFFHFPVIWGRNLWVSWPSDKLEAPMPDMLSHFYPEHYAAAIANLKAEARSIGAVGTMLDAEPYGDSIQKSKLKDFALDVADLEQIQNAIRWATDVTGPVDIVCPYGSMKSNSYTWSMAGLGHIPWGYKMYYAHTADAKINANPPDGVKYEPGLFTSFVTKVSREVGHPSQMTLTPAEVRAIDMDAVRVRYPSIKGQGVYTSDFAEVMKGWNG